MGPFDQIKKTNDAVEFLNKELTSLMRELGAKKINEEEFVSKKEALCRRAEEISGGMKIILNPTPGKGNSFNLGISFVDPDMS